MTNIKRILFAFFLLLTTLSKAQNINDIEVGEVMPNFFLNDSETSFHSCAFGKLNRIIYLCVWDLEGDTAKSNLATAQKLYGKYKNYHFKNNAAFNVITVAVGKDMQKWKEILGGYKLDGCKHSISFDGYWDIYVKTNKIVSTPLAFLIDENGKVVNSIPTETDVENYVERIAAEGKSTVITGKVLVGDVNKLAPLTYRKIYVTDKNNDTIQTVITNGTGTFVIKNNLPKTELSITVSRYPEINTEDNLFLATEKGKIIGVFDKKSYGFSYKFLPKDVFVLKPLEETDPDLAVMQMKKRTKFVEHLFKLNEVELDSAAKSRLDFIAARLKENPGFILEVNSHTDISGNAEINMKLSKQRVDVITKYFISKGIQKKLIVGKACGDLFPVIRCVAGECTEEEMELNRRTEFAIVKPK